MASRPPWQPCSQALATELVQALRFQLEVHRVPIQGGGVGRALPLVAAHPVFLRSEVWLAVTLCRQYWPLRSEPRRLRELIRQLVHHNGWPADLLAGFRDPEQFSFVLSDAVGEHLLYGQIEPDSVEVLN